MEPDQPTPAPEPAPPTYAERLKALLERPGLIEDIFAHMANGGSLIDLAQAWDVRYNDLAWWVTAEKERAQIWTRGCQLGDEWLRAALLREAKLIARADIRDAYDEHGRLLPMKDMPEHLARAIASVEVDELFEGVGKDREQVGVTKKVKFWNKDKMVETLGKQVGLFNPIQKHHVSDKLEDLVAGSKDQSAA